MQVSRRDVGGLALMVITADSTIPAAALSDIAHRIGASSARAVDIADT
jgi:D-3-phosphoglycerate dehydrogenase